jgi:uncharacterized protein YebE (UPF0316 family)
MSRDALLMVGLAMASVGLWTLRVAIAARGMKLAGSIVAATEAVVFALTFSHLVSDLGSPDRLIGYAVGVAGGTALGLVANDRLTPGHSEVHVVVSGYASDVVDSLHARGWPATWASAEGPTGPVTQIWLTVDDLRSGAALSDLEELAPRAFWTVRRLKTAHASEVPVGYRQIRARRIAA